MTGARETERRKSAAEMQGHFMAQRKYCLPEEMRRRVLGPFASFFPKPKDAHQL